MKRIPKKNANLPCGGSDVGSWGYPPPKIKLLEIGVEAGFANSLSIESPEDTELPQLKDLDGWNEWTD